MLLRRSEAGICIGVCGNDELMGCFVDGVWGMKSGNESSQFNFFMKNKIPWKLVKL